MKYILLLFSLFSTYAYSIDRTFQYKDYVRIREGFYKNFNGYVQEYYITNCDLDIEKPQYTCIDYDLILDKQGNNKKIRVHQSQLILITRGS